jgi:outer membrane murein-binding lipoprotein Lpp
MIKFLTFGAVVAALAGNSGCTDIKPLQAQVDDLKQQVARISSDEVSLKSAVDNAAQTASRALSAAEQAQNRADAAASAAQAAQQSCDAVNDMIDRMFKKSPSK